MRGRRRRAGRRRRPRSRWPRAGRDVVRRRQGDVPARQVLRRRPDHAGPARARARSASTRPTVPTGTSSTPPWLRSPSGREVCVPLPHGAGHVRRRRAAAASSTPRWSTWPRGRGRRCARATAFDGARRADADHVDLEVDGLGTVARPLRDRRRRDVVPDPQGARAGRARLPAASGTPSASTLGDVTGPAAERLYVWFDADLLPGYVWSFPLPDGRANIGFGVLRDGEPQGAGHEGDCGPSCSIGRTSSRRSVPGPSSRTGTPRGRSRPASTDAALTDGRVLFVGDAAAATDVMTGEGIGQALLTGRLAAEAIIAAGARSPTWSPRRYETEVRHAPGRRPPHVGACSAGCSPTGAVPAARSGRRRQRRLGPSQLRPVDVRGRTAGDPHHAAPLAPPLPAPPRRLPSRSVCAAGT